MGPRTAQARAATVAIGLTIIAGGCSADQAPAEPDPRPRYQKIPEDLCDDLRVEEVSGRFDLSMDPAYERTSHYETRRTHWYELCWFWGWAEDGRFATEVEDFEPSGTLSVRVYHELADAQGAYDQDAQGDLEFRADREPGATTAELTGWWDSGMSLEWIQELDPESFSQDEDVISEISSVTVQHLIRHENLVVEGYLEAVAPTEDVAEAFALLHDLERALFDEAVEHLTLTG